MSVPVSSCHLPDHSPQYHEGSWLPSSVCSCLDEVQICLVVCRAPWLLLQPHLFQPPPLPSLPPPKLLSLREVFEVQGTDLVLWLRALVLAAPRLLCLLCLAPPLCLGDTYTSLSLESWEFIGPSSRQPSQCPHLSFVTHSEGNIPFISTSGLSVAYCYLLSQTGSHLSSFFFSYLPQAHAWS